MKNGLKLILVLSIPLLAGVGIGYIIKPSQEATAETARSDGFEDSFPVSVQVQDRSALGTDQISNSRQNAITRAVARVSPTVVGINVTEVREQQGLISNDPLFRRFFEQDPFFRQYFGNRKYEVKGLGSGVIISPDGYIITNDHVAGNATEITVTLVGGKRLKAELIGTDPLSDLALLKVEGNDLPYVTFGNSDDVVIGEWAIALGNPFGLFEINDKPTVTVGVISSTGMNLGRQNNRVYRDMIETDAAINGGNSGGPLVNSLGEVVGINTLIFTGGVSQTFVGYGFAIPVNKVKRIVAELRKRGKVERDIWTGFEAQQVDARVARYFGMTQVQGVIVSDVFRNGPAEKAGIKVGDIILEISGEKINSEEELFAVLNDARPGDVLRLKVYREKKEVQVQLRVEQKTL
ncbi:MAG: trypsin-like peptidase domain-containing protein [Bacteroidota bacterium]